MAFHAERMGQEAGISPALIRDLSSVIVHPSTEISALGSMFF